MSSLKHSAPRRLFINIVDNVFGVKFDADVVVVVAGAVVGEIDNWGAEGGADSGLEHEGAVAADE